MNLLNKTLVAAGVATAVLATGAAQAATINFPSTATTPAVGKTIVNESVRTVITPVATVVTLGAGESLSVDDSVTFTLSSGTFAAIVSGDLTHGGGGTGTFALVSGGIGSATATFRVTVAAIPAASLITLAATATVTGTAIADNAALNVQVDMSGFVGGAATALFGSPLTSLNAQLAPAMTGSVTTAVTGVFDVAAGFAALNGVTPTAAGATTTGAAVYTPVANAASVAGTTTGGQPVGVPTPAATLITISGPMTGVSAITAANILGTTAAGGGTTPASTGIFAIDTANNLAHGTTVATAAVSATMTFDGTTAYDASAYTATGSLLSDVAGGYGTNANIGSGTLFSFTRNGSSFTSNSFGSLNKMTVTDRSGALGGVGADGAIGITAFDAAGAAVTCTGLTIANVPNNGSTTIQGADVLAACPGAKRIEGIVNSTTILTTNIKTTADGATMQASGNNTSANIN